MKEKCEWKDRKYEPCKIAYNNYLDLGKPYGPFWNQEKQIFFKVSFCPWCGADIRKPKPGHTDWKILDVNCLEPDFFIVGKYQIKQINGQLEIPVINTEQYQIGLMIVGILQDNKKYRYRPTPTKKNHEELAEEYVKTKCEIFPEKGSFNKNDLFCAYLSGRKSMESES